MKLHGLLVCLLAACEAASPPSIPVPGQGVTARTAATPTDSVHETGPNTAASASATRLARYKEKEHQRPAVVAPVGETFALDDFDIKLGQPELADPETRLPWIANVDERALFRGKRALIVPFSTRNNTPVARKLDFGFLLHTKDGKSHGGGVYNERLAAKQRGKISVFDMKRAAPDTWVDSVLVFDVDPAQLEGAVVYVTHWITVRDRFGRSRSVVEQHAVADIAAPIEAAPIRAK